MWRKSSSVGFRGHLSDIDKTGICAICSMSNSVFLLSLLYMGDSRETAYRPGRKSEDSPVVHPPLRSAKEESIKVAARCGYLNRARLVVSVSQCAVWALSRAVFHRAHAKRPQILSWCNGSTADFDSVGRGSNPCGSANMSDIASEG